MHIIDFEKKIFLVFIMSSNGVMTHIFYFFACNFWTERDFENSFGEFFHVSFPYNIIQNSTKFIDVMTSWRHNNDVKFSIMRANHIYFIQNRFCIHSKCNLSMTSNLIYKRHQGLGKLVEFQHGDVMTRRHGDISLSNVYILAFR